MALEVEWVMYYLLIADLVQTFLCSCPDNNQ